MRKHASSEMPLLEVNGLSFAYRSGNPLFQNIDFSLRRGEIIGIMGPSGCGKTTLAYCLCGIIPHIYGGEDCGGQLKGSVNLCGRDIKQMKMAEISQTVGMVFQEADTQLFSSVIEEEIAFGPENLCYDWEEIHKRIGMSLEATKMEKYRLESPRHISGGQKQLIALSAVLALNPNMLIFDEALSQLDEAGCHQIKNAALALKEQGKGILMIEHNKKNLSVADRIFILGEDGEWLNE